MSSDVFDRLVRRSTTPTIGSVHDKRVTAAEAISLVADGDVVAVGGTLFSRTPTALVFELVRAGRQHLSIARPLSCYEAELLMVAGVADRVITSWIGIGLPWGLAPVVRSYVEQGRAEFDEWSHLGLGLRFKAGAWGVPFLPTFTMVGSDLAARTDIDKVVCPFTEQELLAVPALVPDVALIHAHRADRYGNVQIDGYRHMDVDMARAAKKVIVSVEAIVEPEVIRSQPAETVLPHFTVDAVVHQPLGAYPSECFGMYDFDFHHFDDFVNAQRSLGAEAAVEAYIERNISMLESFESFLELIEDGRIKLLEAQAKELT